MKSVVLGRETDVVFCVVGLTRLPYTLPQKIVSGDLFFETVVRYF